MESYPLIPSAQKESNKEFNQRHPTTRDGTGRLDGQSRVLLWPLIVIAGQSILLAFAFSFFFLVQKSGQVPLPLGLKPVMDNHLTRTYLVTLISTALAAISSFLFARSIQHTLVAQLSLPSKGLKISSLENALTVSAQSLSLAFKGWWTIFMIVVFFAGIGQTAGWNALLTPTNIIVSTPIFGREIDLSSPTLQAEFVQVWEKTLVFYGTNQPGICPPLSCRHERLNERAGPGRIPEYDRLPVLHVFELDQLSGIQPIGLRFNPDLESGIEGATGVMYNTEPLPPFWTALNMTMEQQGVSGAVSCRSEILSSTSTPSLLVVTQPFPLTVGGSVYNDSITNVSSSCDGGTIETVTLSTSGNVFSALFCGKEGSLSENYTTILTGQGTYAWPYSTIVCDISPQIQTTATLYESPGYIWTKFDHSADPPVSTSANISYSLVNALAWAFLYGQTETRNSVADAVQSIYTNQANPNSTVPYEKIWEAYITGMIEFVATASKIYLASGNNTDPTRFPIVADDIVRPIRGNATTATMGWEYSPTGFLILIPTAFFALISIVLALQTLITDWRGGYHRKFDPKSPASLIAAASVGGMTETFSGLEDADIKEGADKVIRLGAVSQGVFGFVEVPLAGKI
ncbi:unnamed protein product [Mycena citricolor]|uniref:Uncharacterized protein n=1 Tax=Mycena citricolor TaxID=2018698 RepID=A0AAD2Q3R8_9AGAR|nr:unnamed protein product [Mycena citricolor]